MGQPDAGGVLVTAWREAARRAVEGLGVAAGGLVTVRDRVGRAEPLRAVVVELEMRGITAVVEVADDVVLGAVLPVTPPEFLAGWGRHRAALLELADGVISISATPPPLDGVPPESLAAWARGRQAMQEVETRRRLPFMVFGVPTGALADEAGMPLAELDALVEEAMAVPAAELQGDAARLLDIAGPAGTLMLETPGCRLELVREGRAWHTDDGLISAADRERGAVVSNLPTGSVYTTVVEDRTEGTVRLDRMAAARDVVLTFECGRVTGATAGAGDAASVLELLAGHEGEPGRVSHIGVGLNRRLPPPTGWEYLDHCRAGAVFLALGENRYMGGGNASTLNEDYLPTRPTLHADGATLTAGGALAV
jgi:leucyl aminopeptidase (aminopeptidase T)